MGALLGFSGRFGAYDAFLQLFLKGGLEKLTPFREEKVFQVVEGLAVGGVIGNEIALVEKGIEFGVKEFTTSGREGAGFIRVHPCKKSVSVILTNYH